MWILYILFGIIGGVFCGLGMGGGTLLIPLISLIGISQKASQTINLISFILTSTVALIFHFKNNLVNCKNIFTIIVPSCLFSLVGSLISVFLKGKVLKFCFGIFLIIVALLEGGKIVYFKVKKKYLKKLEKSKKKE